MWGSVRCTHFLLDAYLLTTQSDRCIHLIPRVHSIVPKQEVNAILSISLCVLRWLMISGLQQLVELFVSSLSSSCPLTCTFRHSVQRNGSITTTTLSVDLAWKWWSGRWRRGSDRFQIWSAAGTVDLCTCTFMTWYSMHTLTKFNDCSKNIVHKVPRVAFLLLIAGIPLTCSHL